MFLESFDGTKIYYDLRKGSRYKPVLVFLHGWGSNWTSWKKEIGFFQKKGYSTLALDLRGHGKSERPSLQKQYGLDYFAKDIRKVLEKEKIKNVVLIGHSLGGMLSLILYKNIKDKIKALVLCSATSESVLEHNKIRFFYPLIRVVIRSSYFSVKGIIEFFNGIKKNSKFREVDLTRYKDLPDPIIFIEGWHYSVPDGSFLPSLGSALATLDSMVKYDEEKILKKIKVPVLIIEGTEDRVLPKIDSYDMFKEIHDAELDFLPGEKHCINIDCPKKIDKIIFGFLKNIK